MLFAEAPSSSSSPQSTLPPSPTHLVLLTSSTSSSSSKKHDNHVDLSLLRCHREKTRDEFILLKSTPSPPSLQFFLSLATLLFADGCSFSSMREACRFDEIAAIAGHAVKSQISIYRTLNARQGDDMNDDNGMIRIIPPAGVP